MSKDAKRKVRQRQILHWAQGGRCAGCGQPMALKRGLPRDRSDYPTYDHIVQKSRGAGHGLINGLLKHFACNMRRGSDPPTGCDRIWHALVLERIYSPAATARWRLEMHRPQTFVVGRQEVD